MIGIESGDSEVSMRIIDDEGLTYFNLQKQGRMKLQKQKLR
jgi:hypothetical protein